MIDEFLIFMHFAFKYYNIRSYYHTYHHSTCNRDLICIQTVLNLRLLTILLRLGIRRRINNSTSTVRSGTTTPRCVHTDAKGAAERQKWFLLELQKKLGG
jgi:hypothetical protein